MSAMDFAALGLSPPLLQVVGELGFQAPTPIQAQSIPVLLRGADVIAQSQTGSGKTAAFALSILHRLRLDDRRLQALVLCPTRELGAQVAAEVRRLGRRLPGLHVLELAGGQPVRAQCAALERGAHVAVGTPGRVLDLLERRALDTRELATVVLDEADRMLDMGFGDDVKQILAQTPNDRQTVLFSATFPPTIDALSSALQRKPERVAIAEAAQAAPDIRQRLYTCDEGEKPALLVRLLRELQPGSAIVFCNFKATVADLARTLREAGVSSAGLQGDLEQAERDRVMATFRNRSTRILVATDVAARGIDVEALDAVFNYELPQQPEVYVHRIGRTGRAGLQGLAISLATRREAARVEEVERFIGAPIPPGTPGPEQHLPPSLQAPMATLFIDAGRKDKMRPGDILGALTGDAGLSATDVGKIEIHDRFSYVAVSTKVAKAALRHLREGRIKGRKHRVEPVRL
jgi:ATP-independent RNA helicase DbpA